MRVTEVWFLKKKDKGDGFEEFHYDYKNIGDGSHGVSLTVNVNLGKLNEANDIATMNILPSNEEPSVLSRSRREEMMQKLSQQEKEDINQQPKEDVHCLKSGMLYTKDVNYYMDYLKDQDEKIACKYTEESHPCSLTLVLSHSTIKITPNVTQKTQRCARGKNIFDMRYIFIPINQGLHFTCAVIYMKEMKIEYYNSLRIGNITRHGCKHKIKMQESTLQVIRDYLQKEHMKEKRIDLPNQWKLYTMHNVPQQDTTNTTDCGVFVGPRGDSVVLVK
jgi:Ulp1 family protease